MKILKGKENDYKNWLDKNTGLYERACFTYAERWAELLEKRLMKSGDDKKAIMEHAYHLSHEAGVEGITGFMYGCSVNILYQCWEYGEELRKWHNKEYGYEGDGVVNPAIMIIRK